MTERFTVMTRKGQITIPAEFRRALGLNEGDRVSLVMEDGHVELARKSSVVEQTRGALRSEVPPMTARELREAAEQAFADEATERSAIE